MLKKFAQWGLLLMVVLLPTYNAVAGTFELDTKFYTGPEDDSLLEMVKDSRVKNVILLIGDGFGLTQLTATQIAGPGMDSRLHIERMPVVGLISTTSANRLITDSAAGATAYATGHKTKNYTLSLLPDSTSLPTVLELAEGKGMATGLVVTCALTHATPAAFYSHVPKRSMETEIARQFIDSGVDVALGGGLKFFSPKSDTVSVREDDLDPISELKAKGYTVALSREELQAAGEGQLIGMFAPEGLDTEDPETPTLPEMTSVALDRLSDEKKGFFLLVEGSQIDWGGHANEEEQVIREALWFDMAVGKALEFAEKDGHTLVIVTADHETGGMSIRDAYPGYSWMIINFSTDGHTPMMVPLFAYGPQASKLMGMNQNTLVGWTIADVLGLKGLLPAE